MCEDLGNFDQLELIDPDSAAVQLVQWLPIENKTIPDLRKLVEAFGEEIKRVGLDPSGQVLELCHCRIYTSDLSDLTIDFTLQFGISWEDYLLGLRESQPADAATFEKAISDKACLFAQDAFMPRAIFRRRFVAIGAIFKDGYSCRQARFQTDAYFDLARFLGPAAFNAAEFHGSLSLQRAIFCKEADLAAAKFIGPARFDGTYFCGDAKFPGAEFARLAVFDGVHFGGQAEFRETRFTREALFGQARFTLATNLHYAVFTAPARLLLGRPRKYPQFERPNDGEAVFRAAKQHAQAAGDYATAGDYHYVERVYRSRRRRLLNPLRWLENIFVRGVFGYGERPANIIIASAVVMLLCAIGFLFWGIEGKVGSEVVAIDHRVTLDPTEVIATLKDVGHSFYFSAATFATLSYGDFRPLSLPSKILAVAEALSGIVLAALFAVCVAKRFARG